MINAGVLLRGQLTVVTETGETLHLKVGDPIVELVDKWHYGSNDGENPTEIIVFYAGVRDMPSTVKKAWVQVGRSWAAKGTRYGKEPAGGL